ncbi:hypothetical protein [Actinoplanes sp. NPDC049316]|uniref:hypothetical protein n=1 Tax=Actinoplanes sp. NPDC049316 TaxID=3154727 RepID=UPI003427423F
MITGMSVATTVRRALGDGPMLARMSDVAAGLPAGAVAGAFLGGTLTGPLYTGVLAFAAVSLLFLALEELLREAHRRDGRPWVTGTLFLGLLVFLLVEQLIR